MAHPRVTFKTVKEVLKTLKGIFAVYKPKNCTTSSVMDMISLQISDDVGFSIKSKGVFFSHSGLLEYPAEGVVVCGLGMSSERKMKYFNWAEKKCNVTIKLGQATDTHDALGTITEEKPYDHITRIQVDEAVKKFIGPITLPVPHVKVLLMDGVPIANPEKKLPYFKEVVVTPRSIFCTNFSPPYLSLALGTCAHISSMERTVQGVFTSKHALPTYRWSWPCIQESIVNMREKANNYISNAKLAENSGKE